MFISKIVLIICIWLVFTITSCSTTKSHEYYLDKDETHRDVYKITATIDSEGICGISIGENESYEGLRWSNPKHMKVVDQYFEFVGSCSQHNPGLSTDYNENNYIPTRMILFVYIPENTVVAMLNSGLLLDVISSDTLRPNNPAGVYFAIHKPQSVSKPMRFVCSVGIDSLKGKALLQFKPNGLVTLNISALGYATEMGCF